MDIILEQCMIVLNSSLFNHNIPIAMNGKYCDIS